MNIFEITIKVEATCNIKGLIQFLEKFPTTIDINDITDIRIIGETE